jgi:hypothetical protein
MADRSGQFDWQIVWLILLAILVLGVMATWLVLIFRPGNPLLWI